MKVYRLAVRFFRAQKVLNIIVFHIVLEQYSSYFVYHLFIVLKEPLNLLDSNIVSMVDVFLINLIEKLIHLNGESVFFNDFFYRLFEFIFHRKKLKELPQDIGVTVSTLFLD
jgi:hypothetical protein